MAKIALFNLKNLADQNAAKTMFQSNLAGLKKFAKEEAPQIAKSQKEAQEALIKSLEQLAQAARTIPKK